MRVQGGASRYRGLHGLALLDVPRGGMLASEAWDLGGSLETHPWGPILAGYSRHVGRECMSHGSVLNGFLLSISAACSSGSPTRLQRWATGLPRCSAVLGGGLFHLAYLMSPALGGDISSILHLFKRVLWTYRITQMGNPLSRSCRRDKKTRVV